MQNAYRSTTRQRLERCTSARERRQHMALTLAPATAQAWTWGGSQLASPWHQHDAPWTGQYDTARQADVIDTTGPRNAGPDQHMASSDKLTPPGTIRQEQQH